MAAPTIPTEATEPILAELEAIADAHGGTIPPIAVIERAKDPASAMHHRFEWDDTEAAHQYRLEQARRLIRVTVCVLGDTPHVTRAFVSLSSDRHAGSGYRRTVDVLSDAEMRDRLLSDAKSELATFRRKYASLRELAPLFAAIDDLDAA